MAHGPDPGGAPARDLFAPFLDRLGEGDLEESQRSPDGLESPLRERLVERRAAGEVRYRIGDEVGRGGMGAVHEAEDLELDRRVAVKTLADASDAERVERFLAEAQVTGQLDHPGVVAVHDVGLDPSGRPYFSMKLVRGRDLASLLSDESAREEWPTARFLQTLVRASEAVAFAHERGVLHRDLKPANIMVGRFGEVFVMDWGLAKIVGRSDDADTTQTVVGPRRTDDDAALLTQEGDVMGTPSYMSPEQARGEVERLDERSDVYSLGAILYHVLAGHAPYRDRSERALDVLELARTERPTPLERVTRSAAPELVAICEKAMAARPVDRYRDAEELGEDLRAFLEGRVVTAHRTGAWVESLKWIQRNRVAAAIAGALAVALIVGLATTVSLLLGLRASSQELQLESIGSQRLRLQRLIEEAPNLWPPGPETLTALERWVGDASSIRADVEELLATVEEFAGDDERLLELEQLQDDLDVLDDPERGLLGVTRPEHGMSVLTRLELARSLEWESVASPAAERAWREAIEAIGDERSTPQYGGLVLTPQLGLLPLGPDRSSGTWEFADLRTGAPVRRDSLSGELTFGPDSGLVLVLIPGGTATLGSSGDPASPRYEPGLAPHFEQNERPMRSTELSPFLISKFEVTQAQWFRWTGALPNEFPPGSDPGGRVVTEMHPVARVSWNRATEVLGWLALELPTEAQWEFAARAGTDTPWWTGPDVASLRGRENLRDRSARALNPLVKLLDPGLDVDDGYPVHAPVDGGARNGFGLVHVAGNVKEWCRDGMQAPDRPLRPGDGLALSGSAKRVHRGGGFIDQAERARSACRMSNDANTREEVIGLRPVRALAP